MLHANLMALCVTEPELWSIKVLHCSCDLDLDPMTFIHDFDQYSLEICQMCKYDFLRQGFRKLSSDRQTDRHNRDHIPCRFAGVNNPVGQYKITPTYNLKANSSVSFFYFNKWIVVCIKSQIYVISSNLTKKEFCYINFVLKIEPSRFECRIWFSFQFPV